MNNVSVTESVVPEEWCERVHQAHDHGFVFFDFLTAIDRDDSVEIVVRLARVDLSESISLSTSINHASLQLDSIAGIFAGAGWHEREVGEMFGMNFVGNDMQQLLRHEALGLPPMRKNVVLSARVITEWPGAAEPEIKQDGRKVGNPSRRRQRPPGVPENWLQS